MTATTSSLHRLVATTDGLLQRLTHDRGTTNDSHHARSRLYQALDRHPDRDVARAIDGTFVAYEAHCIHLGVDSLPITGEKVALFLLAYAGFHEHHPNHQQQHACVASLTQRTADLEACLRVTRPIFEPQLASKQQQYDASTVLGNDPHIHLIMDAARQQEASRLMDQLREFLSGGHGASASGAGARRKAATTGERRTSSAKGKQRQVTLDPIPSAFAPPLNVSTVRNAWQAPSPPIVHSPTPKRILSPTPVEQMEKEVSKTPRKVQLYAPAAISVPEQCLQVVQSAAQSGLLTPFDHDVFAAYQADLYQVGVLNPFPISAQKVVCWLEIIGRAGRHSAETLKGAVVSLERCRALTTPLFSGQVVAHAKELVPNQAIDACIAAFTQTSPSRKRARSVDPSPPPPRPQRAPSTPKVSATATKPVELQEISPRRASLKGNLQLPSLRHVVNVTTNLPRPPPKHPPKRSRCDTVDDSSSSYYSTSSSSSMYERSRTFSTSTTWSPSAASSSNTSLESSSASDRDIYPSSRKMSLVNLVSPSHPPHYSYK